MRSAVIEQIKKHKIIAIVRCVEPEKAVTVAKSLHQGGIKLIEVTFNQKDPSTFKDTAKAISEIIKSCPDMIVGAGTVLDKNQVDIAKDAGAKYIVSPDVDEEVIPYTVSLGLVSLPGAYTPTEIKKAHNLGADFVKLFPCGIDAISYLKAVKAPLSHINFLAVGGVNLDNASDFIKAGAVGIGVGSSLVDKKMIENKDWEGLTNLAKKFVEKVNI